MGEREYELEARQLIDMSVTLRRRDEWERAGAVAACAQAAATLHLAAVVERIGAALVLELRGQGPR